MTFSACQITDLVSFPNNMLNDGHNLIYCCLLLLPRSALGVCLLRASACSYQTKPTNAFDIRSAFLFRDSSPLPFTFDCLCFAVVKKHLCDIIKSNATPTCCYCRVLFCCSSVVLLLLLLALLSSIACSAVQSAQLDKVMAFDYCRGLGYNCVSYFAVCSHFTFPAHSCSPNRIPSYGVKCAYDSPS